MALGRFNAEFEWVEATEKYPFPFWNVTLKPPGSETVIGTATGQNPEDALGEALFDMTEHGAWEIHGTWPE